MSKPQVLTPHRLAELIAVVTANSKALHRSAEALLGANAHVQAYLLDHLGVEEISKAHLIYGQWLGIQSGHPPRWNAFWKVFRQHELKTMNALNAGAVEDVTRALQLLKEDPASMPSLPTTGADAKAQLEMLKPLFARLIQAAPTTRKDGRTLHLTRLDATYVDYRGGRIIDPNSQISVEDATGVHAFLEKNIEGFERDWSRRASMLAQAQALGTAAIEMWEGIAAEQASGADPSTPQGAVGDVPVHQAPDDTAPG